MTLVGYQSLSRSLPHQTDSVTESSDWLGLRVIRFVQYTTSPASYFGCLPLPSLSPPLTAASAMATFTPPPLPPAPKRHLHDQLAGVAKFAALAPQNHLLLHTSHPPSALTPTPPPPGSRQRVDAFNPVACRRHLCTRNPITRYIATTVTISKLGHLHT